MEALATDQFDLTAIVTTSDDAIVAKNLDGKILFWNAAATKMYGYTAEEAIGKPIEILIPDDLIEEELAVRSRIAEGREVHATETTRRRKDGNLITVSFSTTPVRNPEGKIVAAAGFARDISAEVERRNEAFETRERLAAIVENASDAIVLKNLDGEILSWNKAAAEMYGYTAEEAIGRPISIVIPDDRIAEELEIRRRINEGAPVQQYATVRRDKAGRRVSVSLSISPVKNARGEIIGAAGFARNISERQEIDRFAAVAKNAHDAIVIKDLDTNVIVGWNEAATRMYGYEEEEALGMDISELIPEHLREQDLKIRQQIKEGVVIEPHETIRRRKDGTLIDVSLSISPMRDETGTIKWAARSARDISERKRLENERAHATSLLARFVNFTAHDFKVPMHHAKIAAQGAKRSVGPDADPELLKLLEIVISNADWMSKRTEGLLKVATLESGQTAREATEAQRAFDESLSVLQSVDKVVRRSEVTGEDLPTLRSNHHLLCFLFQNLIQNACKYRRENEMAKVRVTASHQDAAWEFSIHDNGMGVSAEMAEQIFEPYARDPANERISGLGIGLHFCRLIVNWHGGRIWVEPNPDEPGSIFKFTIPD
ncbi:MAG TPA: PAS domain-containing sensor histidine kinase [Solirubrobacterales bacterium]|nr:PAS domain-containing sensor histidine kinase [Solirubrobacterales bacterium]